MSSSTGGADDGDAADGDTNADEDEVLGLRLLWSGDDKQAVGVDDVNAVKLATMLEWKVSFVLL